MIYWNSYPGPERRRPGIGLMIVLITCFLFWGSVALFVTYSIDRHQETKAIEMACEKMIEYGWAIRLSDCIEELRP